jgi:YHS domain-containing protein
MRTNSVVVITALLLAACQPGTEQVSAPKAELVESVVEPPRRAQSEEQTEKASSLVRITDPSSVCMVNDRYMGSPQIPVQVEGKTYFGCCKMCEKRLRDEPSVRSAMDPVAHKSVDKAVAILARDGDGNVFYFESEQSLSQLKVQP